MDSMASEFEVSESGVGDMEDGLDAVSDDLSDGRGLLEEDEEDEEDEDEDEDDDRRLLRNHLPRLAASFLTRAFWISGEITRPNCGEKSSLT